MINKKRLIVALLIVATFITAIIIVDTRKKKREEVPKQTPLDHYIYYDKFVKPQPDENLKPEDDNNMSGSSIIVNKSQAIIEKTNLDYMLAIQDSFISQIKYFDILKKLHETSDFYKENKNQIENILKINTEKDFDNLIKKIKTIDNYNVKINDESLNISGNILNFECLIGNTKFAVKAIINKDSKSASCIMYLR